MTTSEFPHEATWAERAEWDQLTVRSPGGHVYQSTAWAEQRARLGWRPLYVLLEPDQAALVLLRAFPVIGGASAYVPRGPVVAPGDDPEAAASRVATLTDWLSSRGVAVVATDAEVPAAKSAYGRGLRGAEFHPIAEIQPSRHRVSIELAQDTDDAAVRAEFTKSTRQRIAGAERDGVIVERHDGGGWSGAHPLFEAPGRPLGDALDTFATLLEATGERVGFSFGPRQVFIDWWTAAHAAGMLVYLDARDGADPSSTLGGLILYRHGERLSTVHSADAPGVRESHPGVMHLLRWRAIQLAIREGCTEMDLGGVDVGPHHREPGEGDPMAGLYEHKRSFGAHWVEMTGAHERVTRPLPYAIGRLTSRAARLLRR
ncbi:MAG TPA: GNAT family N-acetyltransferase [Candidatus Limnocylindrales bacterium]|nr:GNAT family N-acetyltransferase [Candidatus Limnocylindrales bacterium]